MWPSNPPLAQGRGVLTGVGAYVEHGLGTGRLDQGLPTPLRRAVPGHVDADASEQGLGGVGEGHRRAFPAGSRVGGCRRTSVRTHAEVDDDPELADDEARGCPHGTAEDGSP